MTETTGEIVEVYFQPRVADYVFDCTACGEAVGADPVVAEFNYWDGEVNCTGFLCSGCLQWDAVETMRARAQRLRERADHLARLVEHHFRIPSYDDWERANQAEWERRSVEASQRVQREAHEWALRVNQQKDIPF